MVNTAQTRKANKASSAFTLIEIMIVVLIIGILLAIAVPNFVRARESSRAKACVANLKALDAGKEQWAMDRKLNGNSNVSSLDMDTIIATYLKSRPACPSGGLYAYTTVAAPPDCTVGGTAGDPLAHVLP